MIQDSEDVSVFQNSHDKDSVWEGDDTHSIFII